MAESVGKRRRGRPPAAETRQQFDGTTISVEAMERFKKMKEYEANDRRFVRHNQWVEWMIETAWKNHPANPDFRLSTHPDSLQSLANIGLYDVVRDFRHCDFSALFRDAQELTFHIAHLGLFLELYEHRWVLWSRLHDPAKSTTVIFESHRYCETRYGVAEESEDYLNELLRMHESHESERQTSPHGALTIQIVHNSQLIPPFIVRADDRVLSSHSRLDDGTRTLEVQIPNDALVWGPVENAPTYFNYLCQSLGNCANHEKIHVPAVTQEEAQLKIRELYGTPLGPVSEGAEGER